MPVIYRKPEKEIVENWWAVRSNNKKNLSFLQSFLDKLNEFYKSFINQKNKDHDLLENFVNIYSNL